MRNEAVLGDRVDPRSSSAALEAWALSVLPRAIAYAESLLRDRGAAEDVVQDCCCRLLKKADTYVLPRDGTRILYRAITNACIDRNRTRPVLSLDGPEADVRAIDPADAAAHRELEQAVDAAIDALPVQQRAALQLKSLGHSLEEIAEALSISANNAGVLVHRARKAVAARLTAFREGPLA